MKKIDRAVLREFESVLYFDFVNFIFGYENAVFLDAFSMKEMVELSSCIVNQWIAHF